jgi:hypothetical protein
MYRELGNQKEDDFEAYLKALPQYSPERTEENKDNLFQGNHDSTLPELTWKD